VTPKAVVIDLALQGDTLTANACVARELLKLLPTIVEHACVSGGVGRFGEKLEGALLPHIVEHVAIDLLVRGQKDSPTLCRPPCAPSVPTGVPAPATAFAGNTSWLDKDRGIMRVRVSYDDPTVTKAALCKAIDLVNGLVMQTNGANESIVEA
jgi:hypothetical protein